MGEGFVLDAWAILALLHREEPAATRVKELLQEAEEGRTELIMSAINLGEVHYSLGRLRGRSEAKRMVDTIRGLRMAVVPADDELVMAAADLKVDHKISYADCFAVTLAAR